MDRRTMLLATSGALATTLAGCLDGGTLNSGNPAQAGTPTVEERTGRRIVVRNTGEVTGEPDRAILDVGVVSTGETANAVRDDLATRAAEVRQALVEYGIAEDAISTNRYHINERVDRRQMERDGVSPDSEEEIEEYTYYQGTHSFTVEVDDFDAVGDVIDVAVDAGADDIGGVTYTLSDDRRSELREEALRVAIQSARDEAEAIADEVGTSIVEATVVDASEGGVSPVQREVAYDAAAEAPDSPPTRLEPGDVTVTATVRIEYEME